LEEAVEKTEESTVAILRYTSISIDFLVVIDVI
jgi:hypothetical protein